MAGNGATAAGSANGGGTLHNGVDPTESPLTPQWLLSKQGSTQGELFKKSPGQIEESGTGKERWKEDKRLGEDSVVRAGFNRWGPTPGDKERQGGEPLAQSNRWKTDESGQLGRWGSLDDNSGTPSQIGGPNSRWDGQSRWKREEDSRKSLGAEVAKVGGGRHGGAGDRWTGRGAGWGATAAEDRWTNNWEDMRGHPGGEEGEPNRERERERGVYRAPPRRELDLEATGEGWEREKPRGGRWLAGGETEEDHKNWPNREERGWRAPGPDERRPGPQGARGRGAVLGRGRGLPIASPTSALFQGQDRVGGGRSPGDHGAGEDSLPRVPGKPVSVKRYSRVQLVQVQDRMKVKVGPTLPLPRGAPENLMGALSTLPEEALSAGEELEEVVRGKKSSPFAASAVQEAHGDLETAPAHHPATPPGYAPKPDAPAPGQSPLPVISPQAFAVDQWLYKDPKGNVQGPFTREDIVDWFMSGFFPPTLPMRSALDAATSPWIPLNVMLKMWAHVANGNAPPGFVEGAAAAPASTPPAPPVVPTTSVAATAGQMPGEGVAVPAQDSGILAMSSAQLTAVSQATPALLQPVVPTSVGPAMQHHPAVPLITPAQENLPVSGPYLASLPMTHFAAPMDSSLSAPAIRPPTATFHHDPVGAVGTMVSSVGITIGGQPVAQAPPVHGSQEGLGNLGAGPIQVPGAFAPEVARGSTLHNPWGPNQLHHADPPSSHPSWLQSPPLPSSLPYPHGDTHFPGAMSQGPGPFRPQEGHSFAFGPHHHPPPTTTPDLHNYQPTFLHEDIQGGYPHVGLGTSISLPFSGVHPPTTASPGSSLPQDLRLAAHNNAEHQHTSHSSGPVESSVSSESRPTVSPWASAPPAVPQPLPGMSQDQLHSNDVKVPRAEAPSAPVPITGMAKADEVLPVKDVQQPTQVLGNPPAESKPTKGEVTKKSKHKKQQQEKKAQEKAVQEKGPTKKAGVVGAVSEVDAGNLSGWQKVVKKQNDAKPGPKGTKEPTPAPEPAIPQTKKTHQVEPVPVEAPSLDHKVAYSLGDVLATAMGGPSRAAETVPRPAPWAGAATQKAAGRAPTLVEIQQEEVLRAAQRASEVAVIAGDLQGQGPQATPAGTTWGPRTGPLLGGPAAPTPPAKTLREILQEEEERAKRKVDGPSVTAPTAAAKLRGANGPTLGDLIAKQLPKGPEVGPVWSRAQPKTMVEMMFEENWADLEGGAVDEDITELLSGLAVRQEQMSANKWPAPAVAAAPPQDKTKKATNKNNAAVVEKKKAPVEEPPVKEPVKPAVKPVVKPTVGATVKESIPVAAPGKPHKGKKQGATAALVEPAARVGANAGEGDEDEGLLWDYGTSRVEPKPAPVATGQNVKKGPWAVTSAFSSEAAMPAQVNGRGNQVSQPRLMDPTPPRQPSPDLPVLFASENNFSEEFLTWCKARMREFTGNEDITLVEFLWSLPSGGEVADYCQLYLGDKPGVSTFVADFLKRRLVEQQRQAQGAGKKKKKKSGKSAASEAPPTYGGPVVNPGGSGGRMEGGTAEDWVRAGPVAGKSKRNKKGVKVDPRLLGFTAATDFAVLEQEAD